MGGVAVIACFVTQVSHENCDLGYYGLVTQIMAVHYPLVASIKTTKGPRVIVVLYLGSLDINPEEQKILSTALNYRIKGLGRAIRFSDQIEELAEQIFLKYIRTRALQSVGEAEEAVDSRICFTKESLAMGYHRSIGVDLIGLHCWRALKFETDVNGDKHHIRQNGKPEPDTEVLFSLLHILIVKNHNAKIVSV